MQDLLKKSKETINRTNEKGRRMNRIKPSNYDQHSRTLKDLHVGKKVSMLDSKTWKPDFAMKRCEKPRSFIVKTENGKTFMSNS